MERETEKQRNCKHEFKRVVSDGIVGDEKELYHAQIVECVHCGKWKNVEFTEPYISSKRVR